MVLLGGAIFFVLVLVLYAVSLLTEIRDGMALRDRQINEIRNIIADHFPDNRNL